MTRKALGRGLGALLSAEGTATATEDASEIPIDLIDPSLLQPRTVFDDAKLAELAQSISANGVVQPLLLRRKGPRYECRTTPSRPLVRSTHTEWARAESVQR